MAGKPWTPAEIATLTDSYRSASVAELLEKLPGRSWWGIHCKAEDLRLRRPAITTRPPRLDVDPIILQLRRARVARGWTLIDLAQRLGTNNKSLSHMERGHTKPSWAFLRRWAAVLDRRFELVTGDAPAVRATPGTDPDAIRRRWLEDAAWRAGGS